MPRELRANPFPMLGGKTYLLTGAGGSIGSEAAALLASSECNVYLVDLPDACERLRDKMRSQLGAEWRSGQCTSIIWAPVGYGRVSIHPLDLADASSISRLKEMMAGILLNGLVALAGGGMAEPSFPYSPADSEAMDLMMWRNYHTLVNALCGTAEALKRGQGQIVFASSMNSKLSLQQPCYAASKAAAEAWLQATARDLGRDGVTAISVRLGSCPYNSRWDEREQNSPGLRERLAEQTMTGKSLTPEEAAATLCLFLHPAARAFTGHVFDADNGASSLCGTNGPGNWFDNI